VPAHSNLSIYLFLSPIYILRTQHDFATLMTWKYRKICSLWDKSWNISPIWGV